MSASLLPEPTPEITISFSIDKCRTPMPTSVVASSVTPPRNCQPTPAAKNVVSTSTTAGPRGETPSSFSVQRIEIILCPNHQLVFLRRHHERKNRVYLIDQVIEPDTDLCSMGTRCHSRIDSCQPEGGGEFYLPSQADQHGWVLLVFLLAISLR